MSVTDQEEFHGRTSSTRAYGASPLISPPPSPARQDPGPLGHRDAADPNVKALAGSAPRPTGIDAEMAALRQNNARQAGRTDALAQLASLSHKIDARFRSWDAAARLIGTAYDRTVNHHQEAVRNRAQEQALNEQVF